MNKRLNINIRKTTRENGRNANENGEKKSEEEDRGKTNDVCWLAGKICNEIKLCKGKNEKTRGMKGRESKGRTITNNRTNNDTKKTGKN